MLKIIAYTGGPSSPSGVFRVQLYQRPLKEFGIEMRDCPSWAGLFPPNQKWLRPAWGLWNLIDRAPDTLRSYAYDLVFFQREMLSTFVTWEPLTKKPRILDVDDAIFAHPRGDFARRLAGYCDHVICGNSFLAEHFVQWNRNVSILATPVDTDAFCPGPRPRDRDRPIIGWMGTAIEYLYGVERALGEVLRKFPDVLLRVVSSRRPDFQTLPSQQVQWIPWSPENEVSTMQEMTIGIMPLEDTTFTRGKCSFKMLLYMACGLPVVVSPVGMNADVLEQGSVGYGASSESQWIEKLGHLLENPGLRAAMGEAGRQVVLKNYSIHALAPQLAKTLLEVAGKIS